MDDHTLRVLEFERILEMASESAITSPGKALVQNIKPLSDPESIRHRIDLISECKRLLWERKSTGIEFFDDLSSLFHRLRPEDSTLEPSEMRNLIPFFESTENVKRFIETKSYPLLGRIASELNTHREIKREIENAIDHEGKITDSASAELSEIRRGIRSLQARIRKRLEKLLERADLKPHIQDFFITERNGRSVIPLKIDSRGRVAGVIHDISNTGETLFIEPFEAQSIGNELESIRAEEKVEEFRILRRLSGMLRESLSDMEKDYQILLKVDSIQAMASFSDSMGMNPPEINEKGIIKIMKGRHPLLWKALKRLNRENSLVPLDFELGKKYNAMVITGLNTGGKTVALKTVGVLHLMALSGMHIPAESGTTIPFLRKVLADIGDEQSIEQNLSTFSAHITRISEIVKQSGKDTLVIVDELGTGTDPDEGGALSCAILRELKRKGALTTASTHLGLLKAFAHSEPDMINGAMETEAVMLDNATFYKPMYRLVIGEPGQSHAFEIASKFGLPEKLIQRARDFMKNERVQLEDLISDLHEKKRELAKELAKTEDLKKDLKGLRSSIKEELSSIRISKRNVLERAYHEAEDIIRKARKEVKETMALLKVSDTRNGKELVKKLDLELGSIREKRKSLPSEKGHVLQQVNEGQRVLVRDFGLEGVVRSVNKKKGTCRVVVDCREIEVPIKELMERKVDSARTLHKTERDQGIHLDVSLKDDLQDKLNLIGQRVEPALSTLERYLNDASMGGLKRVKIIHGIGTGILSNAIRNYLKEHPLVESFKRGDENEGGEAVTVVYMENE